MPGNSLKMSKTMAKESSPLTKIGTALTEELQTLRGEIVANPWRWDPVSFEEFVRSKDHMGFPPLSPRQMEAALAILGTDPKFLFDPSQKKYTTAVCLWGKGSLAFDEPFMDCVTGMEKTVEEWAKIGKQINVKAYDFKDRRVVTVKIDPPVLEDTGDLVEVHTEAGYIVRANVDHKFWVQPGKWAPVKNLKAGDEIGTTLGLPLLFEPKFTRITGIRRNDAAGNPMRGPFYGLTVPEYGNYIHNSILHANSGKDSLAAIVVCYIVYVLLCLKKPYEFLTGFDIPTETIDIVNVACSFEQASNIFFTKLKGRVKNWKWLRRTFRLKESGRDLDPRINKKEFLADRSIDAITIYPSSIMFPNMIRAFSRHSKVETQEGLNIIAWIMDEASAFKDNSDIDNGDNMHSMLRTSANSRFSGQWLGMILSFPRHKNDFTMRIYNEVLQGKWPGIFASKGATWEINPTKKKADFQQELDNPITAQDAASKYECNPPHQENPFIDFPDKVAACVNKDRLQIVEFDKTYNVAPTGVTLVGKKIAKFNISRQPDTRVYVARVDLGQTKDLCALSIGHLEGGRIVLDLVTHWKAEPEIKCTIDVDDPARILVALRNSLINIKYCTYDQWNSASSINALNSAGIFAEKFSLGYEEYKTLRDSLYTKTLDLPDYPLLTDGTHGELVNLKLFNGNKVDHDACLTGDTKVALLDGRDLPFTEVIREHNLGKELWTYSIDLANEKVVPKRILNPHFTKSSPVVKVTLDNGEAVRCTVDHRFMRRNGDYVNAEWLKPGDSLMPLYRGLSTKGISGYELVYDPFKNKRNYTHWMFCCRPIRGYVIHHVDFNHRNNAPNNLHHITKQEHQRIHSRGQSNEERLKRKQSLRQWHASASLEDKYIQRRGLRMAVEARKGKGVWELRCVQTKLIWWLKRIAAMKSGAVPYDLMTEFEKRSYTMRLVHANNPERVERQRAIANKLNSVRWKDHVYAFDRRVCVCGCGVEFRARRSSKKRFAFQTCYIHGVFRNLSNADKTLFKEKGYELPTNHKVVSVELCGVEDVYDLEIEGTHNFAISAGIFVHNSHTNDLSETVCGVVNMLVGTKKNLQDVKISENIYEENEVSAANAIWSNSETGGNDPFNEGRADPFGDSLQGISAQFHGGGGYRR